MSNKSNYVLLNYDELNEKGLAKLVKEIGNHFRNHWRVS